MGRSRYQFEKEWQPYFVTLTVVRWMPLFGSKHTAQVILESLEYLQKEKQTTLFGYIIMENHLHFIAASEDLSENIRLFKSFTARMIIDYFIEQKAVHILEELKFVKKQYKTASEYQFWQEGSHPQAIQSDNIMKQKLEYIHQNPVKKGYVDEPIHWRYSSARNYAGLPSLLEIVCID